MRRYQELNQFGRLLGMEIIGLEPGHVKYRLPITSQHLSNPEAVHGGAVAAFMDAVLGVAALSFASEEGNLVSTVEFKLNYFRPVRSDDVLIGEGKVVFHGNKLIGSEAKIYSESDNVIVAQALGTFNAYPISKHPEFNGENNS